MKTMSSEFADFSDPEASEDEEEGDYEEDEEEEEGESGESVVTSRSRLNFPIFVCLTSVTNRNPNRWRLHR